MLAAINGDWESILLLLDRGANIDMPDNQGKTALMYAALNERKGVIEALMHREASIDMQDKDGMTALMYAARNGHLESVKALISSGANTKDDFKNNNQESAYDLAELNGNVYIGHLIDIGGDVESDTSESEYESDDEDED